uniref:Uncharacterized protein n=1 Tax=Poecilia mexicana TaxID=48701 RepID=A0A3B3Y3Q5_9TELE
MLSPQGGAVEDAERQRHPAAHGSPPHPQQHEDPAPARRQGHVQAQVGHEYGHGAEKRGEQVGQRQVDQDGVGRRESPRRTLQSRLKHLRGERQQPGVNHSAPPARRVRAELLVERQLHPVRVRRRAAGGGLQGLHDNLPAGPGPVRPASESGAAGLRGVHAAAVRDAGHCDRHDGGRGRYLCDAGDHLSAGGLHYRKHHEPHHTAHLLLPHSLTAPWTEMFQKRNCSCATPVIQLFHNTI